MSDSTKPPAIILIGGGEMSLPYVETAVSLGCKVFVTDIRDDAPAAHVADGFLQISGDNIIAISEFATRLAEDFDVIAAYGGADFAVRSVNAVFEAVGRPRPDLKAVSLSLNKYASKTIWLERGLPTQKAVIIQTVDVLISKLKDQTLSFPFIIKPLDSCGSQGVRTVNSDDEVIESFKEAQKYSDSILVEELFHGIGIDVNGFFLNGRFFPQGIAQRMFTSPPYHIPVCGFAPPLILNQEQIRCAYRLVENACSSLGLDNTPVKGDLLFGSNGFTILEVSPRFHGDVVTCKLLPYASGINPFRNWISAIMGLGFETDSYQATPTNVITYWKALIPLDLSHDFSSIDTWLREFSCKTSTMQYHDMILYRSKVEALPSAPSHLTPKDNSSVIGFFWASFDSELILNDFTAIFAETFKNVLL